jgi:hypothetical protein
MTLSRSTIGLQDQHAGPPISILCNASVLRNASRFVLSGSVNIVDGRIGKLLNFLLKPLKFVQRHIGFPLFDDIHSASTDMPGGHARTFRLFRNKLIVQKAKSQLVISECILYSSKQRHDIGAFEHTLPISSRVSFVGRGIGTVIFPLDS